MTFGKRENLLAIGFNQRVHGVIIRQPLYESKCRSGRALFSSSRQAGLAAFLMQTVAGFPAFQRCVSEPGFGIDNLVGHDEGALVAREGESAGCRKSPASSMKRIYKNAGRKSLGHRTVAKGPTARALLARGIRPVTFSTAAMNLDCQEFKRVTGFGAIQWGNSRRQR